MAQPQTADDARTIAQEAIHRQATHEAVCEERHRNLRGDIASIKGDLAEHIRETKDHRSAVRSDLANMAAANANAVKTAVTEGIAVASTALGTSIAAVNTKADRTETLVTRLLWACAFGGIALLVFFIIQTLILWKLPVQI